MGQGQWHQHPWGDSWKLYLYSYPRTPESGNLSVSMVRPVLSQIGKATLGAGSVGKMTTMKT